MGQYFTMLVGAVLLPWFVHLGIEGFWPESLFVNEVFHTFLETIIAGTAFLLGAMAYFVPSRSRLNDNYKALSTPYLVYALFTFFHSGYSEPNLSHWYITLANFIGGLCFFSSVISERVKVISSRFLGFGLILGSSLFLAVVSSWLSSWIPESHSLSVNCLNVIGALFFVIPWLLFLTKRSQQYLSLGKGEVLRQGLFFFTTSLLLFSSDTWSSSWWWMHLVKLIGFGWLLSSFYLIFLKSQKETTLRKNRLEDILLSTSNWIWEINTQFQFIYSNKNVKDILGYEVGEVIGAYMSEFMSPEEFNKFKLECHSSKSSNSVRSGYDLIHRDQTSIKIERQISLIYDTEGDMVGYRGSDIDVTHKVQQEKQLILAENIVRNTWDAIIATDLHDRPIKVNRAFERLTGLKGEDIMGVEGTLLREGAESPEFYLEVWNHINAHGYWSGEMKAKNSFGFEFPIEMNITCARDPEGKVFYYLGVFSDISKRKESEKQLKNLAYFDQLTSLPNRRSFQELCQFQIENARRTKKTIGLFYMDLDNFKDINDTMGHDVGDQFLIEISRRIERCIRKSDMACRLGGDEFTLLLTNIQNEQDVTVVAQNLIDEISKPYVYKDHEIQAGGCIGISLYPRDGIDYQTLSKNADIAMFRAKKSGKNQFCFFQEEMNKEVKARVELESEMRRALESGEFQMYYQPKIDLETHKIVGAEALVRWIHPSRGLIPPDEFIPVAEDIGLIVPMGEWIISESLQQVKKWQDEFFPEFNIAINLSVKQFKGDGLIQFVEKCIQDIGIPANTIDLELTESVFALDTQHVKDILNTLNKMGVKISLDDFGTGYSSLSYLKNFPIDIIKIDRSFIQDLNDGESDKSIVEAIISMSNALNLVIVAEGVETLYHAELLSSLKCQFAQGYYFARPLPALELENILRQGAQKWPVVEIT